MLKVFLVDDEPIIVKGLRKLIPWEKLGFEIIGESYDGEEAFEYIRDNKPDLVITDILMPIMNGIQLIKRMYEDGIQSKIIILSGYGEFEYARDALKYGAFEYLLKPVSKEQLIDTLKKAFEKIDMELKYTQQMEKMREQLRDYMPILKNKLVLDVINGLVHDANYIRKKTEMLEMDFSGCSYTVFAIVIDNIPQGNEFFTNENDRILLEYAVENITTEIIRNHSAGYVVTSGEIIYAFLIFNDKNHSNNEVFEIANEIRDSILQFLNISVSIGLGREYRDILQVNDSYEEANKALKSKFVIGIGSIIHINNIVLEAKAQLPYPQDEEKKVLDSIMFGSEIDAQNLAENLINSFAKASGNNTDLISSFCLEFRIQLGRTLRTLGGNTDIYLDTEALDKELKQFKTINELKELFATLIRESWNYITETRKTKEYDAVQEAKAYIESNFSMDLSLIEVASKVYMSPTYFSALFKSKTKENFCNYLARVRMNKAAALLLENRYKTYEIAQVVGYKSPRYFSDAFKRFHGLTPAEFREKKQPK